jgi:hypothetical protein
MWPFWKWLVTAIPVVVALTILNVVPGDGTADAQAPPPTCYATTVGSNVPGPLGPTWNAAGGFYTYTWTWTVDFDCGAGGPTACYICEAVWGTYSTNGGTTWMRFTDGSNSVQPAPCGNKYQVGWKTTLNAAPGSLYNITFGYTAYFADVHCPGCGDCGYLVAKQYYDFAVPC